MRPLFSNVLPKAPDYYVLDVKDLVDYLRQNWTQIVDVKFDTGDAHMPDVSYIIKHVIDSIKQEEDAPMDLAAMAYHDIAAIVHFEASAHNKVAWYNEAHVELSNLTVKFGMMLIERIKSYGIYKAGYFPYHFSGWVGDSILVQLDETFTGPTPGFT